jgi:hypothetical protein
VISRARALIVAVAAIATACGRAETPRPYEPGLGEIMTLNQMRHAKLWLAGEAGNWPLAAYEVDELEEGFQDAATFHPTHKDSPVSIAGSIAALTPGPIRALRGAIEQRDPAKFAAAFDALTEACNDCHRAANFGFNVVTRPTGSAFPNQDFSPRARSSE